MAGDDQETMYRCVSGREERVDCAKNSKWSCASAGCCWAPQANAHLPSCFYGDQKLQPQGVMSSMFAATDGRGW